MKKLILVALALLLLGGGYLFYQRLASSPATVTAVVRRGSITATVETTGRVRAARQATLSLQTGGTVRRVAVQVGDRVEAGQVLLELETTHLERSLAEARINLALWQTRLEEARARPRNQEVEVAQANLRRAAMALQVAQARYDEAAKKGDASHSPEAVTLQSALSDYDIAKANFEATMRGTSPEEIEVIEKQRELAEIAVARAEAQLAQTRLLAPFAGTVVAVEPREGENVHPVSPLVVLADLSTLEIMAEVDEIDVGQVAVGQEAEIRLDAFPGQALSGRLTRLAPAATTERGSTVYQATIAFEPGDLPLRPGMGATVKITTKQKEGVLLVPNRAIRSLGRSRVVTVLDGGRDREVEVETGLSNESETEILAGLEEGWLLLVE